MNLKHTYWLLRHGKSMANELDIIVSDMANGIDEKYGLSEVGQQQARQAGASLKKELQEQLAANRVMLYSSPFSRTMQTAQFAVAELVPDIVLSIQEAPELRERSFGCFELQSCSKYELVWVEDAKDSRNRPAGGGESVQDVADRTLGFVHGLEASLSGSHHIILVSHGDALSILAAALLGTDLEKHREHGLPNCGLLRIPLSS